jgi:hypothetical protein
MIVLLSTVANYYYHGVATAVDSIVKSEAIVGRAVLTPALLCALILTNSRLKLSSLASNLRRTMWAPLARYLASLSRHALYRD